MIIVISAELKKRICVFKARGRDETSNIALDSYENVDILYGCPGKKHLNLSS